MTTARPQQSIDLNADVGEATTPEQGFIEAALFSSVTSVNIACGGHAGDEGSMRLAVVRALEHGVSIGAHPSYPDRPGFGRARMAFEPAALVALLQEQTGLLIDIARSEGATVEHCKPHGALYHAASACEDTARAVWQACCGLAHDLSLVGQAGSRAVTWWRSWGATVLEEAFVDRAYEPDGTLRSRSLPDAVITSPTAASEQALRLATRRRVRCTDGTTIPMAADTLCVHADTPDAPAIAAEVVRSLKAAGVAVARPTR